MGKEQKYQVTIRSHARQCLESGADTMTCYVLDDITSRTEKTFINRYIKTLVREIEDLKYFNMMDRVPLLEKTLQICKDRLRVLSK